MAQCLVPNTAKRTALFRALFRVPLAMLVLINPDLIAHRPVVCDTEVDGVGKKGIPSEVKVTVCMRLVGIARSIQDLVDEAKMGKETTRYSFREFCVEV